ncbi:AraC family transcriptional regulator [Paenibacillus mesotrionivorans]|uniref:DUF6597 domain-containing transcriptional factor n=1 Tax=Paenibacillus mesotrionivorans TaxID=3160968 RepID=A0ACC7NWN6_9BACL
MPDPNGQKNVKAAASSALFSPVQTGSRIYNPLGRYREWKPCPDLQGRVCCYWYLPARPEGSVVAACERMVPDGCIDLILQWDRMSGEAIAFVVGTVDQPVFVPAEDTRWDRLGIRFYPGGLQHFLKEPGHLFTNRIYPLAEISKSLETELTRSVRPAVPAEELVLAVQQCLLARLQERLPWDHTFRNTLRHIYLAKGRLTVHELSQQECVSSKQLGRIFLERTGLSTKTFTQIIRFQQVLRHLNQEADPVLIRAALEHGYYDQAHFIHEFVDFSGLLPSDYVKQSG